MYVLTICLKHRKYIVILYIFLYVVCLFASAVCLRFYTEFVKHFRFRCLDFRFVCWHFWLFIRISDFTINTRVYLLVQKAIVIYQTRAIISWKASTTLWKSERIFERTCQGVKPGKAQKRVKARVVVTRRCARLSKINERGMKTNRKMEEKKKSKKGKGKEGRKERQVLRVIFDASEHLKRH